MQPYRRFIAGGFLITGLLLSIANLLPLRAEDSSDAGPAKPLLGFKAETAQGERELEAKFDARVRKDDMRAWMKRMTAHPHPVGSPHGKEVARFIAEQFKSWGFETEIESFEVLFPTPKERLVEMTAPAEFTARLAEPPLPQDATSALTSEQLPTYNAYSIDGDVTAEVVYANYGLPKDYEELAKRGISVQGKIVLTRYGGTWRGLKPKLAAEQGAIGCLIYSDPREGGFFDGDTYPDGAWRNAEGVQRGSVADMPICPGDPLTPGIGATREAKRLAIKDAPTLTKIPVLPLSSADALPLLKALTGPVAPEGWRGALPITYHLGPGATVVHLRAKFNWQLVPAYDVIARLPGAERPEQWIIRGNHHDAWVCGADDPVSGLVAMMEEARVVGELARQGWRPKRTILFCAWDAEEPGLLGSTEWVETHADELKAHAVAYLNGDSNSRGFLFVEGSHTLEKFMNEVARDVLDPETKVSVLERTRARALAGASPENRREIRERPDFRIGALGSGSDYTPFLQHLGIASLDLGYGGEGEGGSYHSVYDSFDYFTRFVDPAFEYETALVQTGGRAILRLANADLLPFEFNDFAETMNRYVQQLVALSEHMRTETQETNRLIRDRSLALASDPTQTFVVPAPKEPVPFLNFASLQNAVQHLQDSARSFQDELKRSGTGAKPLSTETERELDGILMRMERLLTQDEGLPTRPWYKHMIYAPGLYTGYGVKTIPGVREAIEQRQWNEVDPQVKRAALVLDRFAGELERARDLIRPSP